MTDRPTAGYAGFARLYWMFLGPMLLLLVAFSIVNGGGAGWLAPKSLAFLGLLAFLFFCRWAEFHAGDARTSDGEPATAAHLRQYVMIAGAIGIAVWAAAHWIGTSRTPM